MASRFVPVPGLDLIVAGMPELGAVMATGAEAIADMARGNAPVDEGDYRNSIEGHSEVEGGMFIGVVSASGEPPEQAIYLEFGTNDTPTFAPLRRAAERFRI